MSTAAVTNVPPPVEREPGIAVLDDRRGTAGMICTIATEGTLFICLFFAYFFLAKGNWRWVAEEPPKLTLAIIMLIVLWVSSGVLFWGEKQIKAGRYGAARAALAGTILLGLGFLALSAFDYKEHLEKLTPRMNAYGSIFYTITTFHVAHLIVGLFMLFYVLILPELEPTARSPHRPFHNASLYWHFVDFVWIWIVAFLYVAPNIR